NISKEILANCGILACFQTHFQKDLMVELLNLEEEQRTYLSMLKKGTCILRVNSIEKPFVLEIPLIKRKWLSRDIIEENNEKILNDKIIEQNIKRTTKKEELYFITKKKNKRIEAKNIELDKKGRLNKNNEEKKAYCKFCGKEIDFQAEYCSECLTILKKGDIEIKKLENYFEHLVNNNSFFSDEEK
ncbi:MAG: hypothetical protein ACTSUN_06405, partial [Promethearchaeota archaeon]